MPEAKKEKKKDMEKQLGKITSAEFGIVRDYPFLIGLQLSFSMVGEGISDGGKYTVNISKTCNWKNNDREKTIASTLERVYEILNEAKVNCVSELVGKPVEITIDQNCFKDFRILTEVL